MVGTKVSIPKGRNGRALKNFRKTQKKVSRRIGSREGLAGNAGNVGDELARLSGIPSAQRSKRPKDDPFEQIGL